MCQDDQLTSLPIIPRFPPRAGREPPLEGRHCQHHTWIMREGAPSAHHGGSPERWWFFSQLEMPQWKTRAEVTFLASCSAKSDLLRVDPITHTRFCWHRAGGRGARSLIAPRTAGGILLQGRTPWRPLPRKVTCKAVLGFGPIVFPFRLRSSSRFFFLAAGLRPWLPPRIA